MVDYAHDPSRANRPLLPLEPSRVADACRAAQAAIDGAEGPAAALGGALDALFEHLDNPVAAVLVLEHDRLWHVASRGFAITPDGLPVTSGVVGRAVRSGRTQYVPDLAADPDYVEMVRGVASEIAVPLVLQDGLVVGVLNLETSAALPRQTPRLLAPLGPALAPLVAALRDSRSLDLASLARLFAHVSSLRDPQEIASIAVSSLSRILPVETSQLYLLGEGTGLELTAVQRRSPESPEPLPIPAVEVLWLGVTSWTAVEHVDLTQALPRELAEQTTARSAILIMLRANGDDLGLLVGMSRWFQQFERGQGEAAAILAAQGAASLDAALSLGRERRSALTDPLTGLLNRRGFELELEAALASAQEGRTPLSLWVLDCDDFKDVNDRAGHEFGDALLREVAVVLASVIPEHACAARLGGDEFVVMLPERDAAAAETIVADLSDGLAAGLQEAGFPLRLSGGISTFPFDGGGGSQLVRAADQALYEAKASGKNTVVSFHDLVREGSRPSQALAPSQGDRLGRTDPGMLVEAAEAATVIFREATSDAVFERLCKTVTFVVGATGCNASRVEGPKLVDVVAHSLRDVDLNPNNAYLIDDFPLTKLVLESQESRSISFLDDDLDPAEAFVMRNLRMNCVLLLPLVVDGRSWGLIELYDMRLRRFTREQQAVSEFLVGIAARRIEALGARPPARRLLPLYRLPEDE